MYFAEFKRPGCNGSWTGYATSPDGVHWQVQNSRLMQGFDAEILKVTDDIHFMYYARMVTLIKRTVTYVSPC